jgi:hypothetical protein
MSTVKAKKIQLGTDATATNNFTIYQPTTPDRTIRIGQGNADNPVEVAKITSAGIFSSGHILQVVNKTISTQGSQTIGTTDTQIGTGTDFDLSITPKGNGSKFIVSARWFGEVEDAWNVVFNIHRDGVRINADGATAYNRLGLSMATQTYGVAENDSSTPEIMYVKTVDSAASTVGTGITYTLVASSTAAKTMWTNRCFLSTHEQGISELIVMEVAA